LAYTWLPPGPGSYTISYEATYPCGTVSGSTLVTINPAPTPTLSVNVYPFPGSSGYCPGFSGLQIIASASVPGGLYSIDVGDDGIIEAYYPSYFLPSPGVIPAGGLPIKVSFDDGCGNVVSTIYNYVPSSMADPGAYTASASISPLLPPRCPGDSISVSLYVPIFLATLSEIFNGAGMVALGRRPLIALRLGWRRLSRQVLGRFTAGLMLFLPIPV
jgi:hypothetical protein